MPDKEAREKMKRLIMQMDRTSPWWSTAPLLTWIHNTGPVWHLKLWDDYGKENRN